MRWERVAVQGEGEGGPGKRWGHTCTAIGGGRLLYVFGGYGKDNCQTNKVHVFDTVSRTWSEPAIKGIPPAPRDSHSCTAVGDSLFVFGGTDGRSPLGDLHFLDTSSNTWITPYLRGDGPAPREGHSAALIGKRLFIFGGCGKYDGLEKYYDDVYILNTETLSWKCVVPIGAPPTKRDSHTCSSWKNKIIVIGGEDVSDYYLSDVHILDTDTLLWCKLNTTGQLLSPRAGHTTVALGKYLFVFGGFSSGENLYDDVHVLDLETSAWTKVNPAGEGPSARFSMAGEALDPNLGGVLVFMGGCNKHLEALADMYYLYTGLNVEYGREERRAEKLSFRKQLRLKCQEESTGAIMYNTPRLQAENSATLHESIPYYAQSMTGPQNIYVNHNGKPTFEAKVTKGFANGYTIETYIGGKLLRGLLFCNKAQNGQENAADPDRKVEAAEGSKISSGPDNSETKPQQQNPGDVRPTNDLPVNTSVSLPQMEAAAGEMNHLEAVNASQSLEGGSPKLTVMLNFDGNGLMNMPHSSNDVPDNSVSAGKESSLNP